jgi:peroxiredoxin
MKQLIYILFFYLMALNTLPSIRAIKIQFRDKCEMNCNNSKDNSSNSSSGCEKSKIVMGLNFSPVQFIKEYSIKQIILLEDFQTNSLKSYYEALFISKYQEVIWHPPKFFIL